MSAVAKVKKAIAKARAPDRSPAAEERRQLLADVRARIISDLVLEPKARNEVYALLERMMAE